VVADEPSYVSLVQCSVVLLLIAKQLGIDTLLHRLRREILTSDGASTCDDWALNLQRHELASVCDTHEADWHHAPPLFMCFVLLLYSYSVRDTMHDAYRCLSRCVIYIYF
jgi:hypothetical protein